ncbi:hypothetical protein Hanom_Chr02g00106311 [Helianthus anomalus]
MVSYMILNLRYGSTSKRLFQLVLVLEIHDNYTYLRNSQLTRPHTLRGTFWTNHKFMQLGNSRHIIISW